MQQKRVLFKKAREKTKIENGHLNTPKHFIFLMINFIFYFFVKKKLFFFEFFNEKRKKLIVCTEQVRTRNIHQVVENTTTQPKQLLFFFCLITKNQKKIKKLNTLNFSFLFSKYTKNKYQIRFLQRKHTLNNNVLHPKTSLPLYFFFFTSRAFFFFFVLFPFYFTSITPHIDVFICFVCLSVSRLLPDYQKALTPKKAI